MQHVQDIAFVNVHDTRIRRFTHSVVITHVTCFVISCVVATPLKYVVGGWVAHFLHVISIFVFPPSHCPFLNMGQLDVKVWRIL